MESLKALIYAGNGTPLGTIDSALWAGYHGDIDQLSKLIVLTPDGEDAAAALFANLPAETRAQLQSPAYMTALLVAYWYNAVGYQVQAAYPIDGDPASCAAKILVQTEDGRTIGANLVLRQADGSWRIECDQSEVKRLAVLLTGAVLSLPAGGR
jgi:hypothetical protein